MAKIVSLSYNDNIAMPSNNGNSNFRQWLIKYIMAVLHSNLLTDRQKQVMRLYYIDNLTQRQIAERLHINITTVSRHHKYAIKKIKRVFIEVYENGEI